MTDDPTRTPTANRVRVASSVLTTSPHYTTTRRHSLYGTEDRVVIDPGSRVWKVGFSGEARPRATFRVQLPGAHSLWSLSHIESPEEQQESDIKLFNVLVDELRTVFYDILLTDPKSRKVVIVEHPLMPIHVKESLACVLFEHLHVPSVSFLPSGLLSLLGVGKITGLIVDCGYLQTTVLPVFSSRPLYAHLKYTPLAGSRFNAHLRALLIRFGVYHPPPSSLSMPANFQSVSKPIRVPPEILTDAVIEIIRTRCCFVGEIISTAGDMSTKHEQQSDPSLASSPQASNGDLPPSESDMEMDADRSVSVIHTLYQRYSLASDLRLRVGGPPSQHTNVGSGTLVIPGWIRERAAEVIFEGGDLDEQSVVEVVLESLTKLPLDIRARLASSILVTGGTAMLPGFTTRLRRQLLDSLAQHNIRDQRSGDRNSSLRPLQRCLSIINDHTVSPTVTYAPAFSPAIIGWVGGSLAGALKIGTVETSRERWDEASSRGQGDVSTLNYKGRNTTCATGLAVLPDWSRGPLTAGAPLVGVPSIKR